LSLLTVILAYLIDWVIVATLCLSLLTQYVRCVYIRRTLTTDLEKLQEEIIELDKDLQKQNEILSEICRKVRVLNVIYLSPF